MNFYNIHTLSSGLRIIHLPSAGEVVYCGYAIAAGARHERCGEEGLAHFCEHMTFKGTERRTSLQVINALERMGGELNAFTAKEETVYYSATLRQYFTRAVDLLTDIVFHSTYPQQEIEKEVEVVCDEIESYRDTPSELIYDEFENKVFSGSPLGHNVLGTKESVRRFTTADCLRFTRREYLPQRMVFYVLGNIDFKALVRRLEKIVPLREALTPAQDYVPDALHASVVASPEDGCEGDSSYHQAHVMTGAVVPLSPTGLERIALFIVNNMLGGPSMNSRLNLSLRERRGLVYTVESIMTTYTDTYLWAIYFASDPHDSRRCQRLVANELARLRRAPLSASTLAAAKRQLKGQLTLAAENRESYAIDMAKQFLHRGTLRSNDELCRRIDEVTPHHIHNLMNTHLAPSRFVTLQL